MVNSETYRRHLLQTTVGFSLAPKLWRHFQILSGTGVVSKMLRNLKWEREHLLRLLTVFFLAVWWTCLAVAKENKKEEAVESLSKAMEMMNIRGMGAPPFKLHANLRLPQKDGTPLEGSYRLIWESKSKWREEVAFPGYDATSASSNGKTWLRSTPEYRPYIVMRLIDMLDVHSHQLRNQRVIRILNVDEIGSKLICVDFEPNYFPKWEYCFDSIAGTLARAPGVYANMIIEFGEYAPWEDRKFPHSIRMIKGDQLVAEWHVDELASEPNPDPALFVPPANINVRYQPNCEGISVEKAKLIVHPNPTYPQSAKNKRISGVVRLFAIIGTDGLPHALNILQSAGSDLDGAALEAVGNWRYQPATCSGTPVDVATEIDVSFALP